MFWKNAKLSLLFLVLSVTFTVTLSVPVDGEHYSVEEQDPSEQIPNVDDKDYGADKPIYEIQYAVFPQDEQSDTHEHEHEVEQPTIDNQNAPVFEEQEIAYPSEQEVHEQIEQHPVQYQTSSQQSVPVWEQQQTTKQPVQHDVVTPTWQHSSPTTTTKTTLQEVPVWIYPHNQQPTVVHPVATVPVWHQPVASTQAPVPDSVPVSVSVPTQTSHSQVSQNPVPVPIFPDFGEAESIADPQDNADTYNPFQNVRPTLKPTKRPSPPVEVVEQFHVVKPSGITEYKLVLSNGMTNYKKIYNKLLPSGKIVTVQEGYDSVPIPGDDPNSNNYQTQYYIADEFGHNVYRVEKQTRRPKLPGNLDYKQQGGHF